MLHHGLHDGREARDRATTQVVAVTESTRQHYAVETAHVGITMPNILSILAHAGCQCIVAIALGPSAGEHDDAKSHGWRPFPLILRYASEPGKLPLVVPLYNGRESLPAGGTGTDAGCGIACPGRG